MKKYRRKPVVIEAVQFTDENKDQVFNWISCTVNPIFFYGKPAIKILTPEGSQMARIGDYIIKDDRGYFYPCEREWFEETYEEMRDERENMDS